MNSNRHDTTADASAERKAWIDPLLEEFDVETATEAGGPGLVDAGIFS